MATPLHLEPLANLDDAQEFEENITNSFMFSGRPAQLLSEGSLSSFQ